MNQLKNFKNIANQSVLQSVIFRLSTKNSLKLGFIFATLFLFNTPLMANDSLKIEKKWKYNGISSFAFSQVALSNWAAGGEGSYTVNGILNLYANYKGNKSIWENGFESGYGIQQQESTGSRKTDDKFIISSKYGYELNKQWYSTATMKFNTQFTNGFDYKTASTGSLISSWMAPAYFIFSLGADYKPNADFSLSLSPVTTKWTFVLDDSLSAKGAYGVSAGENYRSEFGGYLKIGYKKDDIIKNVSLRTSADFFSNYIQNPEYIDVMWDLLILMKINKFLTASVNTTLLYDYDTKNANNDAKIQFKEILGIGISYKF